MTTSTLSSSRPSQKERADVKKEREAIRSDKSERRMTLIAEQRYFKGLQEIKSCIETTVSIKALTTEALDDLFEKYSRGEGRNKVDDVAELKRRLQSMK